MLRKQAMKRPTESSGADEKDRKRRNIENPSAADLYDRDIDSHSGADPYASKIETLSHTHRAADQYSRNLESRSAVDPYARNVKSHSTIDPYGRNVESRSAVDPFARNIESRSAVDPYASNVLSHSAVDPYARNVESHSAVDPYASNVESHSAVDPYARNEESQSTVDPYARKSSLDHMGPAISPSLPAGDMYWPGNTLPKHEQMRTGANRETYSGHQQPPDMAVKISKKTFGRMREIQTALYKEMHSQQSGMADRSYRNSSIAQIGNTTSTGVIYGLREFPIESDNEPRVMYDKHQPAKGNTGYSELHMHKEEGNDSHCKHGDQLSHTPSKSRSDLYSLTECKRGGAVIENRYPDGSLNEWSIDSRKSPKSPEGPVGSRRENEMFTQSSNDMAIESMKDKNRLLASRRANVNNGKGNECSTNIESVYDKYYKRVSAHTSSSERKGCHSDDKEKVHQVQIFTNIGNEFAQTLYATVEPDNLKCPVNSCTNAVFKNVAGFVNHWTAKHMPQPVYSCSKCSCASLYDNAFINHFSDVHKCKAPVEGTLPVVGHLPPKNDPSPFELKGANIKMFINVYPETCRCPVQVCDSMAFDTVTQFTEHWKQMHEPQVKVQLFKCGYSNCKYTTKSRVDLTSHYKDTHRASRNTIQDYMKLAGYLSDMECLLPSKIDPGSYHLKYYRQRPSLSEGGKPFNEIPRTVMNELLSKPDINDALSNLLSTLQKNKSTMQEDGKSTIQRYQGTDAAQFQKHSHISDMQLEQRENQSSNQTMMGNVDSYFTIGANDEVDPSLCHFCPVPACGKLPLTPETFRSHWNNIHTPCPELWFYCQICYGKYKTRSKKTIKAHFFKEHRCGKRHGEGAIIKLNVGDLKCLDRQVIYQSPQIHPEKYKIKKDSFTKTCPVPACKLYFTFDSVEQFIEHWKRVHEDQFKEDYQCCICAKKAADHESLCHHLVVVHKKKGALLAQCLQKCTREVQFPLVVPEGCPREMILLVDGLTFEMLAQTWASGSFEPAVIIIRGGHNINLARYIKVQ